MFNFFMIVFIYGMASFLREIAVYLDFLHL